MAAKEKEVKNRIGELRRSKSLNQKELGEVLGVAQTTISAWETGKTEPDMDSLMKMSQLFWVPIGYIMGLEEDPKRAFTREEIEKMCNSIFKKGITLNPCDDYYDPFADGPDDTGPDYIPEEVLLEEWEKGDRQSFPEMVELMWLVNYLSRDQRQRLVNVAKAMFPAAARGKYMTEVIE